MRNAEDRPNTTLDLDAKIRFLQRERFLLVTKRQVQIN